MAEGGAYVAKVKCAICQGHVVMCAESSRSYVQSSRSCMGENEGHDDLRGSVASSGVSKAEKEQFQQ